MRCLDSDILVAILRGNKEAQKVVEKLDLEGRSATTTINAFDILFGAKKSTDTKAAEKVKTLLSKLEILNFDLGSSEEASEIAIELEKKGQTIDLKDILTAAIAITNGCEILTRNIKHFSRVKGLKVQKW